MRSLRESHSYLSYKNRILAKAKKIGFTIQTYSPYPEYPHLQTVLIYNPALITSSSVAIHISGTHGGEGAAGAEVQLALLKEQGENLLESEVGFLMIFALNPFGFHFLRRTSIENIDLNRNTGDGLVPATLAPHSQWLRPLWRSHNLRDQVRGLAQTLTLGAINGFYLVARTFAEGQHLEKEGLFYAGTETAIEIKSLLARLKPLLKDKKSLTVVDVHTGLGKLYEEMLIHCSGDPQVSRALFKKPIEIPGEKPKSYRGAGLLSDRLSLEFPESKLHYVVQEFGVKSTARSFFILSLENQFHWKNFGRTDETTYLKHPIKDLFFDTFFSTNAKWLAWLRKEGSTRFMQIFNGR